jgi:hypothetical protein
MIDALLRWVQRQGTAADRGAGGEGLWGGLQQPDLASASGASIGRNVILFLAADPSRTTRLALDEQCAAIERELRMTASHHDLDFHSRWAVTIDEMMHHLNGLQPSVVHFSGRGAATVVRDAPSLRTDRRRDAAEIGSAGIILQDTDGEPKHVTASALTRMIGSAAPSTRLVVLNACYSQEVARSLCRVVDCAIGMHGSLGEPAARAFAVALYRALGYCRSVDNALAQAAATLEAHGFGAHCAPVCHTRKGISAARVVLPRR